MSGACVRRVIEPYLARVVRHAAFLVLAHDMARRWRSLFSSYHAENMTAVYALVRGSIPHSFEVRAGLYAHGISIWALLRPRIANCERRSCPDARETHLPCSAWSTYSMVQASRRLVGGRRRKRRRRASGRRSSAVRAAGAVRLGRVCTSDGVRIIARPTPSERFEGVRADPRAVDRERSIHLQGALAGGIDGARRAHAASCLFPIHSHALALLIALFQGVARAQPSCARVHRRGTISRCWRQYGEGTSGLRIQRAPIPSSISRCTLVPQPTLSNYKSGGVQPARVADTAIRGESESERSIGAHAFGACVRLRRVSLPPVPAVHLFRATASYDTSMPGIRSSQRWSISLYKTQRHRCMAQTSLNDKPPTYFLSPPPRLVYTDTEDVPKAASSSSVGA